MKGGDLNHKKSNIMYWAQKSITERGVMQKGQPEKQDHVNG